MGVSFGRSRVADLSFQVFNRALHPEWFATRAFRRVAHSGWEADLRIIEVLQEPRQCVGLDACVCVAQKDDFSLR